MQTECNAKINIGLNVVEKRSDGYHNIETIFYPIPLCDVLDITVAEKDNFVQTGIELDCPPENNIVIRAINAIANEYQLPPLSIRLEKKIPSGAGLGGGSSDAAFAIKLVNQLCNLGMSDNKMRLVASGLGADCAFFIENKPAFADQKGENLSACDISLSGLYYILVKPPVHVSTKDAYKLVKPRPAEFDLRKLKRNDIREWKNFVVNDFEKSVFAQYPSIAQVKEELYSLGAVYASMSGSGSAVFGIFDAPPTGEMLKKFDNCKVFSGMFR